MLVAPRLVWTILALPEQPCRAGSILTCRDPIGRGHRRKGRRKVVRFGVRRGLRGRGASDCGLTTAASLGSLAQRPEVFKQRTIRPCCLWMPLPTLGRGWLAIFLPDRRHITGTSVALARLRVLCRRFRGELRALGWDAPNATRHTSHTIASWLVVLVADPCPDAI